LEDAVRTSLANGAQVNISHEHLGSALYPAAFNDDELVTRLLINNGVDVLKVEGFHDDALQLAAFKGSEKVLRLLWRRMRIRPCTALVVPLWYGPYGSLSPWGAFDMLESLSKPRPLLQ